MICQTRDEKSRVSLHHLLAKYHELIPQKANRSCGRARMATVHWQGIFL
ncbi:MAG: hypothetical protein JRI35_06150 [Deltaproteobacteria bacterium]|nr:hypothetical protein [Deltaproteobacteria bacterium]